MLKYRVLHGNCVLSKMFVCLFVFFDAKQTNKQANGTNERGKVKSEHVFRRSTTEENYEKREVL